MRIEEMNDRNLILASLSLGLLGACYGPLLPGFLGMAHAPFQISNPGSEIQPTQLSEP